jgi:hypothetical protein
VTPHDRDPRSVWQIAAVLTSPVASAIAWHHAAGTGLSTTSMRIGPGVLAAVPWPSGDLSEAVAALASGHIAECGEQVTAAYGLGGDATSELISWWTAQLGATTTATTTTGGQP